MKFIDLCMKKKIRRAVALILTVAFMITAVSVFSTASLLVPDVSAKEKPYILLDNEKVNEVILREDAKLRLYAYSPSFEGNYNWQIAHPEREDFWVNIDMAYSNKLWLTTALVSSMCNSSGEAKLRCKIFDNETVQYTDPLKVTVSYTAENESFENNKNEMVVSAQHQNAKLAAKAGNNESDIYLVVVNYLFDDNTIAYEPFGLTLAAGDSYYREIVPPKVTGYLPYRRVGDQYLLSEKFALDIKNIQSNITINVIYEPDLVDFSIHHHKQDIYDDNYSVTADHITTGKAFTGSYVGDGLALTEDEWAGFKPLAYEHLEVAADGSTVIEIRYDRKYYLVDFDMNGGYGTEPIYARYETTFGANIPTRHGYIFDGWELVSYDGKEPTAEQKSKYDINGEGKTIAVPAANISYRAKWIVGQTKYTMVFWAENPDDNEYSYWGHIDNIPAMSGDIVSARDIVGQVNGINDEQYFEFNIQKSDKNVVIEGDGSTVVNVYYTRKLYTITFTAPGLCRIDPNHIHNDDCYEEICGSGHIHNDECVSTLVCNKAPHALHTEECIICGFENHKHGGVGCECQLPEHTHSVDCWNDVGSEVYLNKTPNNPQNGQIYSNKRKYYIFLFGRWYNYNGSDVFNNLVLDPDECGLENHIHGIDCDCSKDEHLHDDSCYSDELHTHSQSCYAYSCGEDEHIHVDECFRLTCPQPTNHKHSNSCNRAIENSTVKFVKKKYGSYIGDIWPITDGNGKKYDSGQRWSPESSSYYNAVLVYIAQMTPDDFTLKLSTANYDTFYMQYYLQALPGNAGDTTVGGIKYDFDKEIKANYSYITKAEDFFDIKGFTQKSSNPSFDRNNQIDIEGGGDVKFYYTRNTYKLEFSNNGQVLSDKTVNSVYYESPLKEYYFIPDYPSNLEPGAYQFGGWYTSPGCFDGSEVDWDTVKMADGDLMLYAKWSPKVHNVNVFLTADMKENEQIGSTELVPHGEFAIGPTETITNGDLIFQGWFYMDEGTEKAFVFKGIPIIEDINVYAKWSSHISVDYTVYFKLDGTDINVADPITSSTLVGNNKTFDAKVGNQLYEEYRNGYYPHVSSHTVTMSLTGSRSFTFYYTYVEEMPYKVRYVNDSGVDIIAPKIVKDNRLSVVTETFVRVNGMMPDAYQKRLILSSSGEDLNGDNILDSNEIIFRYKSDTTHAYYRVVHYVENIAHDSKTYREYRSEEAVGLIGVSYEISAITLTGFEYAPSKTVVLGATPTLNGNKVTATLGADGLLIELYYDRAKFDYEVQYVKVVDGVDVPVANSKSGEGYFGQQILEYALDLSSKGYNLASTNDYATLTISATPERNVIRFVYDEANVTIKYETVGPPGSGTLSLQTEHIRAISGVSEGSLPKASNGFIFAGWYLDADCTRPVDSNFVKPDNSLAPQKQGEVWKNITYYAKFDALQTNLTITTTSVAAVDANQAFLFTVKGKVGTDVESVNVTVVITGNGSVTITDLPVGEYTVTNHTEWSWRFGDESRDTQIKLEYHGGSNQLTYAMSRTNNNWLDDNNGVNNNFKD